jgi:hypothetical protein
MVAAAEKQLHRLLQLRSLMLQLVVLEEAVAKKASLLLFLLQNLLLQLL